MNKIVLHRHLKMCAVYLFSFLSRTHPTMLLSSMKNQFNWCQIKKRKEEGSSIPCYMGTRVCVLNRISSAIYWFITTTIEGDREREVWRWYTSPCIKQHINTEMERPFCILSQTKYVSYHAIRVYGLRYFLHPTAHHIYTQLEYGRVCFCVEIRSNNKNMVNFLFTIPDNTLTHARTSNTLNKWVLNLMCVSYHIVHEHQAEKKGTCLGGGCRRGRGVVRKGTWTYHRLRRKRPNRREKHNTTADSKKKQAKKCRESLAIQSSDVQKKRIVTKRNETKRALLGCVHSRSKRETKKCPSAPKPAAETRRRNERRKNTFLYLIVNNAVGIETNWNQVKHCGLEEILIFFCSFFFL